MKEGGDGRLAHPPALSHTHLTHQKKRRGRDSV